MYVTNVIYSKIVLAFPLVLLCNHVLKVVIPLQTLNCLSHCEQLKIFHISFNNFLLLINQLWSLCTSTRCDFEAVNLKKEKRKKKKRLMLVHKCNGNNSSKDTFHNSHFVTGKFAHGIALYADVAICYFVFNSL